MACNKDFTPYETQVTSITEPFDAAIEVNYELFKGQGIANGMNEAIQKTIIASFGDFTDKPPGELQIEAVLTAFDEDYKKFVSDFGDNSPPWELNIESEVIYQSKHVITVAINTYQDKGGAHGNDSITLLNLNPENGDVFQSNELIKDLSGFKQLAESHFFDHVKNNQATEEAEDYFFGEDFQLPNNIGFSEEGIILLYNVYEIASYAQGYTEFTIPYEEAHAYLNF